MSYDLTFFNEKNLTREQIDTYYESSDGKYEINKEKKSKIIQEIKSKNINFEIPEDDDDDELNFKTYRVVFLDNVIVISIPEKKQSEKVADEIQIIFIILLNNEMSGYDRQSDTVFGHGYNLKNALGITETAPAALVKFEGEEKSSLRSIRIVIISLLITLLVYALIKYT